VPISPIMRCARSKYNNPAMSPYATVSFTQTYAIVCIPMYEDSIPGSRSAMTTVSLSFHEENKSKISESNENCFITDLKRI